MGRFEKRIAVVTGGASGIGYGIAERFAEEGANVVIIDRDPEAGAAASARLTEVCRRAVGVCEFLAADVSSEQDVIAAINKIAARFSAIDHLVNNAGIVLVKGIAECTSEEWDRVLAVNLKSVFLLVKYALPWLSRSPQATVVNIGSVSSFIGQQNTPAYVASKGGVLLLTKALALDLAPSGIRVNCVCPGITETPMFRFHLGTAPDPEHTLAQRLSRVPLMRALSPREVADSVLYLAGSESSGVTGTSIVVDAGYTAAAEWSKG